MSREKHLKEKHVGTPAVAGGRERERKRERERRQDQLQTCVIEDPLVTHDLQIKCNFEIEHAPLLTLRSLLVSFVQSEKATLEDPSFRRRVAPATQQDSC